MTVFTRKEVEAFVMLRDGLDMTINGLTMMTEGVNTLLETTEPKEQNKTEQPKLEEINSLISTEKTSSKGPYNLILKTENPDNPVFDKLQSYITQNGGFVNLHGKKFWTFSQDPTKKIGYK